MLSDLASRCQTEDVGCPAPNRETDNIPPAPLAEVAWRRRVAGSARWAGTFVLGNLALLVATRLLPSRLGMAEVVAWFVLGGGAAVATWRVTARRPGGPVDWRAWLLRGSLPGYLAVLGLLLLGMHLEIASYVTAALLVVTGWISAKRFGRSLAAPKRERRLALWSALDAAFWIVAILWWSGALLWLWAGVLVLLLARAGFHSIYYRASFAVDHHWWFDNQTAMPGEWLALLVHRDEHVEVVCMDETLGWFASEEEATEWLEDNGYLPAERALAERLVDRIPPDNLLGVKPRKTSTRRDKQRVRDDEPRVRDDEPRVRVAAEAEAIDGKADDIEEPALDDAEPPRAMTVHDPRDPRT